MKRMSTLLRTFGVVTLLGIATLALPLPAHAGGVHVSIGFGLPFPVVVAPQPVVVVPQPVIVQQAPVIVQPEPTVVYQPPVVVTEPQVVYAQPSYGGYPYYRDYYRPWRHHHHHYDGDREEHGQH